MNLPARHTGDQNGRAGHVDLLNVHAKFGEEPFFLRDPKRANPGADISVTNDDFRRREEESWCEDNAKHESYREVEFFHRKQPLRLAEIEKAVDESFTTPSGQWRRRIEEGLGAMGEGCAACWRLT